MSLLFKKYRDISFLFLFILILMVTFLLFVFFFFFVFFFVFFSHPHSFQQEAFQQNLGSNSNIKNILFLGDSILNNQLFVSSGETVQDLLKKQLNSKTQIFNYAQDGATISSVYQQLDQIPNYLNASDSILFISIGGNDILSTLIKDENRDRNSNRREEQDVYLSILFEKYQILLKTIQEKMKLSKMYLLDIYYPIHPYFQLWIPFLEKWNHLLKNNKLSIPVITISNDLNQSNDFTEFIEPSKIGAEKIVEILYNYCIA